MSGPDQQDTELFETMGSVKGGAHLTKHQPGDKPRIGIMGGTFDPIHNGHLVAASEVAWALNLDEVIFVPTGNPSFKQDKHVTAAEHRYLMTVIATSQNPQFSVSRVDIDRPGVTYTIDTLKDLRKEFPDAELFFITGADAIAQMATWKDADKLFSMAKFVAVGRPGYKLDLGGMPEESVIKVEIPALAISSTDCRHRASIGEPLWYLVPDGVVRYIDKYGLYRGEGDGNIPDLPSARRPELATGIKKEIDNE